MNDGAPFMTAKSEARLFFDSNKIVINKNKDINVNLYSLLIYNTALSSSIRAGISDYLIQNNDKSVSHMESYSFQKCLDPILSGSPTHKPSDASDDTTQYNGTPKFKEDIMHNDTGLKVTQNGNCPNVYKQGGDYMVSISHTSKYGKRYNLDKKNRYLTKNYGQDKKTAKEAYLKNYGSDCSLPDELQTNVKVNKDHSASPFMIDNNPNTSPNCYGVKWDMKTPQNMGAISDKCRREVVTHCENNNKHDNACSDWHPDNYDSDKAQTNRRYFQPADPRCKVGNHEIEDHPDYNKYIRRDKVPCWNCKL